MIEKTTIITMLVAVAVAGQEAPAGAEKMRFLAVDITAIALPITTETDTEIGTGAKTGITAINPIENKTVKTIENIPRVANVPIVRDHLPKLSTQLQQRRHLR